MPTTPAHPSRPSRSGVATLLLLISLLPPLPAAAVEPPVNGDLPGESIHLAVIERLFNDPGVRNAMIDVEVGVDDAMVTLSGLVGSAAAP